MSPNVMEPDRKGLFSSRCYSIQEHSFRFAAKKAWPVHLVRTVLEPDPAMPSESREDSIREGESGLSDQRGLRTSVWTVEMDSIEMRLLSLIATR
jgi:hypothetical protein